MDADTSSCASSCFRADSRVVACLLASGSLSLDLVAAWVEVGVVELAIDDVPVAASVTRSDRAAPLLWIAGWLCSVMVHDVPCPV